VVRYAGLKLPAESLTRNRTFQTNLLEPLETEETRRFSAFGREVLVVDETDAQWGQATAERTPIDASARVTNSLPAPIPVTEIQYTVRMNGIVVGSGQAAEQTVLPAQSTRTLEARAVIDNSKLDDWWVTHLRNNQTTRLTVTFDATVQYGAVERTLPWSSSPTTGRSRPTCSGRGRSGTSPSRGRTARGTAGPDDEPPFVSAGRRPG